MHHDRCGLIGKTNTTISVTSADGTPRTNLWQPNKLGRLLFDSGHDVRLPGVTGWHSASVQSHNLVTNGLIQSLIGGFNFPTATVCLGTDPTTPDPTMGVMIPVTAAPSSTLSCAPSTSASTPLMVAIDGLMTGVIDSVPVQDTLTYTASLVMTASASICSEGLTSSGFGSYSVWARQTFPAIAVNANDIVTVVHTVQFSL